MFKFLNGVNVQMELYIETFISNQTIIPLSQTIYFVLVIIILTCGIEKTLIDFKQQNHILLVLRLLQIKLVKN